MIYTNSLVVEYEQNYEKTSFWCYSQMSAGSLTVLKNNDSGMPAVT